MNINATLFVQAFNFFIVYGIVRLLLFKPVIAIIEHEKSQSDALYDIINQQKNSIEIQQKEYHRNWHFCQEYFALHAPQLFLDKKVFFSNILDDHTEASAHLSHDSITNTAADIRNALEEKIKHVH